jgi:hypothetical protein
MDGLSVRIQWREVQGALINSTAAWEVAMTISPIFKETYEAYLSQVGELDLTIRREILGIEIQGTRALIPFFDETYCVDADGIVDAEGNRPSLSVCVIICKYLLMCPQEIPRNSGLVTFKDFKDAAPLIHFFSNTVQGEVARRFSGKAPALEAACRDLEGSPYEADLAYQIKYQFKGLPRIPVYLLFNDAEEGFAAQCTMLFERTTEVYLDMESVAMLAGALSDKLRIRSTAKKSPK